MSFTSCTSQLRIPTLEVSNFLEPLRPVLPFVERLQLGLRALGWFLNQFLVDFDAGQEDILHGHSDETPLDSFNRMVLLESFWDVVKWVATAFFKAIKESRPNTASDERGEVVPIKAVTLKGLYVAASAPCCTLS